MLTVNLGGIAYTVADDGAITPDTVVSSMVREKIAGGAAPADAFHAVADQIGMRATPAVTAGLGDGGFDELGNWHDPGSGKFAKKGTSTAKALIENLFRKMLADSKRKDGTGAVMLEGIPSIDVHPGDRVNARWHDDKIATVTVPDGRKVRVSWDLLAHPEAYAMVGTRGEGRETPMPTVNEMNVYQRNGRHYRVDVPNRGSDYVPPAQTPAGAAHAAGDEGVVLAFNDTASPALVAEFGPTPRVQWVDSNWGSIVGGDPATSYVYWKNFDLPRPTVNEMAERPTISGKARWYKATVDGETFSPHVRTAEEPKYMLLARDEYGWEAVGYSTATNEADAIADAEASRPSADEYKVVGDLVETDTPPPDSIRTIRRPDLVIDDPDHDQHTGIVVNDVYVGTVRKENRAFGPDAPIWSILNDDTGRTFAKAQEAIDTLVAETKGVRPARDSNQTFTRTGVPIYSAVAVREKVDKLNARAERKGLDGRVTLDVGEPYLVTTTDEATGIKQSFQAVDVTVSTTPVRLGGGWKFAGVVDYATLRDADQGHDSVGDASPVLLHSATGYQLPERFREHAVCDDCGRAMPRNKLIVAADTDGNLTRLGTTCVRDVLGHNPAHLLWWDEAVREIADDEEAWDKPRDAAWSKQDFLYEAIVAIDMFGYGKAGSGHSTRDLITQASKKPLDGDDDDLKAFRSKLASLRGTEREETLRAKADAVVEYIHSDAFSKRTEFGQNMEAALSAQFIIARSAGIAAYAPVAYDKAQEKTAAYEARIASVPNEWVGAVGDKVELTGMVRSIRTIDGFYGPKDIVTIDTDQGVVKTFTTGEIADYAQDALDSKTPLRFTATVKDHDEWPKGSGQKETTLTRAKVLLTRAQQLREEADGAAARRENTVYGVMSRFDQASYLHGTNIDIGIADEERAEWKRDLKARLEALPIARLDEMTKGSADIAQDEGHVYRNMIAPGREAALGAIGETHHVPPGATIGYPYPVYDSPATGPWFSNPGPFTVTLDGELVDGDGDLVHAYDDIQTAISARRDWERLPSKERDEAPQPPKPMFRVLTQRNASSPWQDHGPLTVTVKGGTEYTIATDGSVTPIPAGSDNPWGAALDADRETRVHEYRQRLNDYLEEALARPVEADDDILTPDNLDALTATEYTKGRKTFRIEPGGDVFDAANGKRVTAKTGDPILRAVLEEQGFTAEESVPVPLPAPETLSVAPTVNEMAVRPGPRPVGSHEISAIAGSGPHSVYLDAVRQSPAVATLADAWRGSLDSPGATRGMQWAASEAFGRDPHRFLGDTRTSDEGWLRRVAERHSAEDFDATDALGDLHEATQALLAESGIGPADSVALYRGITPHQFDEWDETGRPTTMGSAPLAAYSPRFAEAAAVGKGGVLTVHVPARNIVALGALTNGDDEVVAFPPDGGVPIVRFRSAETDAALASGTYYGAESIPGIAVNELVAPSDRPAVVTNRSMIELDQAIDLLGEPVEKVKGFKPTHAEKMAMKYQRVHPDKIVEALTAAEKMGKTTIRTPAVRAALRDIASTLPDGTGITIGVNIGLKPDKLHGIADALRRYGKDNLDKLGLVSVHPSEPANGQAMASTGPRAFGSQLFFTARGHSMTMNAAANQGNWVTMNLAKTPRQLAELVVLHEMGHVMHHAAIRVQRQRTGSPNLTLDRDRIVAYVPEHLRAEFTADREERRNMTRYGRSKDIEWVAEGHVLAATGNAVPHVQALNEGVWRAAGLDPADMIDLSGSYYSPEYVADLAAGEALIADRTKAERLAADIAKADKFKPGTQFRMGGIRYIRTDDGFHRVWDSRHYANAADMFANAEKGLFD